MDETSINNMWVIFCAVLIFFMQAGFLCLEAGLTRSKNNINVAIKNLADFGVSVFLFWVIGFGLMFGSSQNGWFGFDQFLIDFSAFPAIGIFFLFQVMFCGTAVTILSGGVAERLQFNGYLLITILVSAFIYPIFGHWAWGGAQTGESLGFLNRLGFFDFAGSSVVHSVGGWVTLATLLIIGSRTGRFNPDGSSNRIPSSSLPMAALGAILLYVGWLGFNGGSMLTFDQAVSPVILNTLMGGAVGLVTSLVTTQLIYGKSDPAVLLNGILAGLVSITASANVATTGQVALIAAIGAWLMMASEIALERLQIDDAVGAIPVHLVAGIWGTLAVGIFADLDLLATGLTRSQQIGIQFLGVVVCGLWAGGVTYLILRIIDTFSPLRVTEEDERVGLNISEHGASSELLIMFNVMDEQSQTGDLSLRVPEEPFTVVGQISRKYNQVMERLEEVTMQARTIIDSAAEGIVTFQPESYLISSLNPAALRMFGRAEDEIIGRPFTQFLHREKDGMLYSFRDSEDLRFLVSDANSGDLHEFVTGRADIGLRHMTPIELTLATGETADKQFHSGIFRDVTDRKKRLEAEAKASSERAANEAKSSFLASMSHEIRTPLNAIIGLGSLLLETELDEEQQDFLRTINNSGESLLVIINDILDFSKIEAGKIDLENHPLNIVECIEDSLDLLATKAYDKGLELGYYMEALPSPMFDGDVTRIKQILINLLGNAIKFTEQGDVTIYMTHKQAEDGKLNLQFEVRDTGIGIPADRLETLFEAFTQADESTTRKYGGTGLGLTISKKLSQLMGGDMWVKSKVGEGSSFFFNIKLNQLPAINEKENGGSFVGRKILVVDDNQTNRVILNRALGDWGMETIEVASAEAALQLLKQDGAIDFCLIDMNMPEVNGLTLAKEMALSDSIPNLPKALLTSVGELAGPEAKTYFNYTMSKPIKLSQLFNLLDSHFSGSDISSNPTLVTKDLRQEWPALNILLVDDNKVNQKVGSRMLNRIGLETDIASDGEEAVRKAQQKRYDLILMDVQMPGLSGPEATQVLREKLSSQRQPWVVALTANAMTGDREKYIEMGMDDYLSKPLRIENLHDLLVGLVDREKR